MGIAPKIFSSVKLPKVTRVGFLHKNHSGGYCARGIKYTECKISKRN